MKKQFQWMVTAVLGMTLCAGAGDLVIRPKNFIVTPSTGPVAEIVVKNRSGEPYTGEIKPEFPEGWIVSPLVKPVTLAGGETSVLSFAVEKGADLKSNVYDVSISAAGMQRIHANVVCASTPYFKPEIDGNLDEWADAIPVSFMTGGKKTVVRSYWNKEQFCLAVDVEEDELIGLADASAEQGMDAIQFALAPGKAETATESSAQAVRYEYLAAASGSIWKGDKCFQLLNPGDPLSTAKMERALVPLLMDDAEVKVKRSDGITHYELAIPMKSMKTLKATAGREYCFSLLVHDPDGTGVRDLGSVMNLQDDQRNPLAWCSWEFAKWNGTVPFDNKVEFGFCSSVH